MSGYLLESTSSSPNISFLISLLCSIIVFISTSAAFWLIIIGKPDKVSDSNISICLSNPLDNDRINAIPIIPILEANAVKNVLHFLVLMFIPDNFNAVKKLILVFLRL